MVSPKSELPSASEQSSAVVRCIAQLERRCCPGASGPMQARRHYSAVFFVPMSVANLDRENSCCGGDRADRADGGHGGKSHYGGGCNSKIFSFNTLTSAYMLSMSFGGVGGRRGSKYTSIWQRFGSCTKHICPWHLCCLSSCTSILSKLLFLLQAASFAPSRRWSILSNL